VLSGRQHNDLGRRLCRDIINEQDSTTAKSRVKQLAPFYRNMPCLVELATSDRFQWTADDLLQLTRGVIRRVVSQPSIYFDYLSTK